MCTLNTQKGYRYPFQTLHLPLPSTSTRVSSSHFSVHTVWTCLPCHRRRRRTCLVGTDRLHWQSGIQVEASVKPQQKQNTMLL